MKKAKGPKASLYRLYAKFPGDGRYSPVDWARGVQVINLIHATLFPEEEKDKVQKDLDLPENAAIDFKWRRVPMGRGTA